MEINERQTHTIWFQQLEAIQQYTNKRLAYFGGCVPTAELAPEYAFVSEYAVAGYIAAKYLHDICYRY